jgi:hypothetical protein
MTNFEYIMKHMTERDIAAYVFPYNGLCTEYGELLSDKIYSAFENWAHSASSNHGNMAKGCISGDHVIEENPSIWAWGLWYFPDGEWRSAGRTRIVAFQVWLSEQYNPEDWEEN